MCINLIVGAIYCKLISEISNLIYVVIGNLTMIKTNCYNVSHTQRPTY
jgi:hypothetical protein